MGEMLAVQKYVHIFFWAGLKLKVSFNPPKISSLGNCPTKVPGLPALGQTGNLVSWIPAPCSSCARIPHCGNKSLGKEKIYLGKKQRPTPGLVTLFVKGLGCFLLGFFFFKGLPCCAICWKKSLQQKEASVWTKTLILNYHIHFQATIPWFAMAEVTKR